MFNSKKGQNFLKCLQMKLYNVDYFIDKHKINNREIQNILYNINDLVNKNIKSNIYLHAEQEFNIIPEDYIIQKFKPEIFAIIEKMQIIGLSGGAAPYYINNIVNSLKNLLNYNPLTPITNNEDDYIKEKISEEDNVYYHHKRCSAVFKSSKDPRPRYVNAINFQNITDENDCFTASNFNNISSRQYIRQFPFMPKKFTIKFTIINDKEYIIHNRELFDEIESIYDIDFSKLGNEYIANE